MKYNWYIVVVALCAFSLTLSGQAPEKPTSGEIYKKIEQLNFLGSVLYFAAHPDDENTRLISHMANHVNARTAYLSITRGDGGQNRIGTQIREKLGLIRTNELVQARNTDGGQQFFTRANDFGYSKHPDETFAIWNKEEVLHDVVKVIREFKPDIVVNRFDHRTPGRTHGHHTGSAMLSVEAFDVAADPNAYKDRLGHLEPWQPRRVFFNTSWWFYGSQDKFEKADKSKMVAVDAGQYYAVNGLSNNEIAALSRSMHKSQGFGSTGTRGSQNEYLELIKGDMPTDKSNPLESINTTWTRVEGGAAIGSKLNSILEGFDFIDPSTHINDLLAVQTMISKIDDDHWRTIKLKEVNEIITHSLGLFVEARTSDKYGLRGGEIEIDLELTNRSSADVQLATYAVIGQESVTVNKKLNQNEAVMEAVNLQIGHDIPYSNPYWLDTKGTLGMYHVEDQSIIGTPMAPATFNIEVNFTINGKPFKIQRPLVHRHNDAVKGEVYEPYYVMPNIGLTFTDPVYILPNRSEKAVEVEVKSYADNQSGTVSILAPATWTVNNNNQLISFKNAGESKVIQFMVKGPALQESAKLSVAYKDQDGNEFHQSVEEIEYDHIPKQVMLADATAQFERISIEKKGQTIAYVQGAGDDIPTSLKQIGYDVTEMDVNQLDAKALQSYDALIIGVRAYNTKPEIRLKKEEMLDYVKNGGTMIVQYNTSRRVKGTDIGPYPFELSRDRVTDEYANVSFELPNHEVLNAPNKISSKDFDNWVQERGLYFPSDWDDKYAAPLACADKGESLKKGGLLIAKHGNGYFIYTGYSWFRELPAGVPGAFRLFANLISIGKNGHESKNNEGGK